MSTFTADVAYQVASKSTPAALNPFASLALAYLVGACLAGLWLINR